MTLKEIHSNNRWWAKVKKLLENPPPGVKLGFDEYRSVIFAYYADADSYEEPRDLLPSAIPSITPKLRKNLNEGINPEFQIGTEVVVDLTALADWAG